MDTMREARWLADVEAFWRSTLVRTGEAADARDAVLMRTRETFKSLNAAPVVHQLMAGEGRGVP